MRNTRKFPPITKLEQSLEPKMGHRVETQLQQVLRSVVQCSVRSPKLAETTLAPVEVGKNTKGAVDVYKALRKVNLLPKSAEDASFCRLLLGRRGFALGLTWNNCEVVTLDE